MRRLCRDVIEFYQQGNIQPIQPTTIYEATDIISAFRYMQTGKHMGKIIIKMPEDPAELPVAKKT